MKRLWINAVFGLLLFAPASRADIILSFSMTGAQSTFTVQQGGTVDVPVYLVERLNVPSSNGSTSGGILAAEGLLSAGVRLNYTGDANRANVTASGAINGPGFTVNSSGFPLVNNSAGTAAVSAGSISGVAATSPSAGTAYVLAGTFRFQSAPSDPIGTVTNLATSNPQASSFPQFLTNSTFVNLDYQGYSDIFYAHGDTTIPISYTSSITVVPVPEPGFLLAAAGPLVGVWMLRRRR